MKLYLLSQNENKGYDTYDSMVVCAENKDDAITIHPNGSVFFENDFDSTWASNSSSILCEEIGDANESQKRGIVIASFNAG